MKTRIASALLLPLLLGACATSRENLLFVETYDLGIGLHPAPSTGMIQFHIGFKATDLAIVPVAGVEGDGNVDQRRAESKGLKGSGKIEKDAVSVFAQFRNTTKPDALDNPEKKKHSVGIGRFFSTGVAAVNLAHAYECGMQAAGACPSCPECEPAVADGSEEKNEKSPIPDKPEPILTILKPLIFGQYDSYGVDIKPSIETGGAAGVDFSLGYSGKNFAVMPLFAEERGRYKELGGEGGRYNKEAYSVLGQFKADQATTSPDLKLERFFATGLAAQYLSRGLQARISADLRSEAARNSEVTGK